MAELVQTAANVVPGANARKIYVTAGGNITAGMPVYRDNADDNKYKAAIGTSAAAAAAAGIALNAAGDGQPLTVQTSGDINIGATLTAAEPYCVSDATAGKIRPLSELGVGDFPTFLGCATTTSNLKLDIQAGGVAKA